MTNRKLQATQRKLERMELEHLRAHAMELREQLEEAQYALQDARISADLWQAQAMNLQDAMHDESFATHRCVGINKSGEMMVVQMGPNP